MRTSGYGGRKIKEIVNIHTNDTKQPVINVVLTGFVESFADITPKYLFLKGKIGEPIKSKLTIRSKEKYPFKIESLRAKYGQYIKYRLDEQKNQKHPVWIITTENIREKRGQYNDELILKTNSDIMPAIRIRVFGRIID